MADAGHDKKAELLAAWRTRWREADFTWAGLAKHELQGWVVEGGVLREAESGRVYGTALVSSPVHGGGVAEGDGGGSSPSPPRPSGPLPPHAGGDSARERPATLQDYWRADPATGGLRDRRDMLRAGEIVFRRDDVLMSDGYLRHVRELSDASADAALSIAELYHIIHLPLEWDDGAPTGKAEWPADALDAIIGPRLAAASETKWQGPFDGKIVGPDRNAQLQGCVLAGAPAHPAGKEAPLCLRLSLALVFGACDFRKAKFGGDARFDGAAFGGDAGFRQAAFGGAAGFEGAAFSGDAGFERAAFGGDAVFQAAAFSGHAGFQDAAFKGWAWFERGAFSGLASFGRAAFSIGAWFQGAAFSGVAWFDGAAFSGDAQFEGAAFAKEAQFWQAKFAQSAAFVNCVFQGLADFSGATFSGDMRFSTAIFDKLALFRNIVWPEAAAHWHAAFDQTLFRGTLILADSGFQRLAAHDGATYERGIKIDEADETKAKAMFHRERREAIAASRTDGNAFATRENHARKVMYRDKAIPVSRAEIAAHVKAQREARLRELERGCRVLKLAMEKAANKSREQVLYRFELQARRAQKHLPPGEALFSDLYALASDYGASMVRPFISLFVLILAFGAIYLGWAFALGVADPRDLGHMAQAIEFSLTNTFRPLSALSDEGVRDGSLGARLLGHDDFTALGVRAVSIVQSLLAIVLAFLFALAVRRRFQIS